MYLWHRTRSLEPHTSSSNCAVQTSRVSHSRATNKAANRSNKQQPVDNREQSRQVTHSFSSETGGSTLTPGLFGSPSAGVDAAPASISTSVDRAAIRGMSSASTAAQRLRSACNATPMLNEDAGGSTGTVGAGPAPGVR